MQYCTFCDCTEYFIAYYGCRRTMKLFKPWLSEYSLTETCNSVKNCIWGTGDTIRRNSQKTWRKTVNLQLTVFHLINTKRYFMSRGSIFSPPPALSHSITCNITIHMKMTFKSYLPEVNLIDWFIVLPRNPYTEVIHWILEQSRVRTWLKGGKSIIKQIV